MKKEKRRTLERTVFILLSVFFFFLTIVLVQFDRASNCFGKTSIYEITSPKTPVDSVEQDMFNGCIIYLLNSEEYKEAKKNGLAQFNLPEDYEQKYGNHSFYLYEEPNTVPIAEWMEIAEPERRTNCKQYTTYYSVESEKNGAVQFRMESYLPNNLSGNFEDNTPKTELKNDFFLRAQKLDANITLMGDSHARFMVLAVISILMAVICLAVVLLFVLRIPKKNKHPVGFLEIVPPDFTLVCTLPMLSFLLHYIYANKDIETTLQSCITSDNLFIPLLYLPIMMSVMLCILITFTMSFIASLRSRDLRNIFLYYRFEHIQISGHTVLYFVAAEAIKIFSLCVYLMQINSKLIYAVLFLLFEKIVVLPPLFRILREMRTIFERTKTVTEGDLTQKIENPHGYINLRRHARDIQSIADRISISADEYIQSSNFKAELITNLSHDIKTPLTSIISYAQLLRNENLTPAQRTQYLDVLNRHSYRLSKLVEDLTEVSDAASGNIQVHLTTLDCCALITQAAVGFEERLQKRGIQIHFSMPDTPVLVTADTRLLWRVVDNMMNNICKYAKENTPIQISVSQKETFVDAVFRNYSAFELNVSGEELMERFVRGDSSRSTEGSGLGLSIAQSLMDLQKGKLVLQTEKDIFTSHVLLHPAEKN